MRSSSGHPQRYRTVIDRDFVTRVDFAPDAVQGPDGLADDIPASCAAYEQAIADAGGVDLQILGIGSVGHIAFNEPGSSFASRTRIKTLTQQTRLDNARFFDGDVSQVPTHCLTQGLGTIMAARHVVLLATGASKARSAPCGRRRSCSTTRTRPCCSTRPPPVGCSSRATTARPSRANPPGKESDR